MNIQDILSKIKPNATDPGLIYLDEKGEAVSRSLLKPMYLTLVILLVGTLSFGLGRLTATGERGKIELRLDPSLLVGSSSIATSSSSTLASPLTRSEVTASSKGTKYYYTNCKNTISQANKVTFATAHMAEEAGYSLASNCKPQ